MGRFSVPLPKYTVQFHVPDSFNQFEVLWRLPHIALFPKQAHDIPSSTSGRKFVRGIPLMGPGIDLRAPGYQFFEQVHKLILIPGIRFFGIGTDNDPELRILQIDGTVGFAP